MTNTTMNKGMREFIARVIIMAMILSISIMASPGVVFAKATTVTLKYGKTITYGSGVTGHTSMKWVTHIDGEAVHFDRTFTSVSGRIPSTTTNATSSRSLNTTVNGLECRIGSVRLFDINALKWIAAFSAPGAIYYSVVFFLEQRRKVQVSKLDPRYLPDIEPYLK